MLQGDYQKQLYYILRPVDNHKKGLGYHLHHRLVIYYVIIIMILSIMIIMIRIIS